MRLDSFTVARSGSLIRLHMAGVYAGECCEVRMAPAQATALAADLLAATLEERPPCPKCGGRAVDVLLPNPTGAEWECLKCGHRWAGAPV